MPECRHTVKRTHSLEVPGDQATIELDPPITHPCVAEFSYVPHGMFDDVFAGSPLGGSEVGSDVGEVHVDGVSAGHVTVTLVERPTGSIRVTISCEGKPPCGPTSTTIQLAGFAQNVVVQATDRED